MGWAQVRHHPPSMVQALNAGGRASVLPLASCCHASCQAYRVYLACSDFPFPSQANGSLVQPSQHQPTSDCDCQCRCLLPGVCSGPDTKQLPPAEVSASQTKCMQLAGSGLAFASCEQAQCYRQVAKHSERFNRCHPKHQQPNQAPMHASPHLLPLKPGHGSCPAKPACPAVGCGTTCIVCFVCRFGGPAWLAFICVTWGAAASCMAFVRGPTSFVLLRMLLGLAESGAFPGTW